MSTMARMSLLVPLCVSDGVVATSQQFRPVSDGTTRMIFFWSAVVTIPPDCAWLKMPDAFPLQ